MAEHIPHNIRLVPQLILPAREEFLLKQYDTLDEARLYLASCGIPCEPNETKDHLFIPGGTDNSDILAFALQDGEFCLTDAAYTALNEIQTQYAEQPIHISPAHLEFMRKIAERLRRILIIRAENKPSRRPKNSE